LLRFRFILVSQDGVQPYDGLFLVLEKSLQFFKLQVGIRHETISTHCLQPCHAYQDVQAAEPPRRGQPPNASKPVPLSSKHQPSCLTGLTFANCIKTVPLGFFACQAASFVLPLITPIPPPVLPDIAVRLPCPLSEVAITLYTLRTKKFQLVSM
jgi:hypothetical protein